MRSLLQEENDGDDDDDDDDGDDDDKAVLVEAGKNTRGMTKQAFRRATLLVANGIKKARPLRIGDSRRP